MHLRPATEEDLPALAAIARAAKAGWGYSPSDLATWRAQLAVSQDQLRAWRVVVAVAGETPVGFYAVAPGHPEAGLEHLWVDPAAQGQGHGRRLFEHALTTARGLGAEALRIESDPNAEPFYLHQGATRVGSIAAPITSDPERTLPVLLVGVGGGRPSNPAERSPMWSLATDRLTLRRFTLEDGPFVVRILNEPSFIENIGDRGVRNLADAARYLEDGPLASYEKHGFGLWRVGLKEGDVPIGMCGILRREILDHADLGYAFLPEYGGQGYAFEAAAATLRYARAELGLDRVLAIVNPENLRSIRLLEKVGFEPLGSIRMPAEERDVRLFGVSPK